MPSGAPRASHCRDDDGAVRVGDGFEKKSSVSINHWTALTRVGVWRGFAHSSCLRVGVACERADRVGSSCG
jgi:hypothetical protein